MDKTETELLEIIQNKGYWKVVIRPEKYKKENIPFDKFKEIVEECQVRQRGWYYPVLDRRNGKTFSGDDYLTSNVMWNEFVEVWRFYQSGQFVSCMALVEDHIKHRRYSEGKYLDVILSLYNITEFFMFAKNLASKKILGDSIRVEIELYDTNQRTLMIGQPMRHLNRNYVCEIDHLTVFKGTIPVTKLLADFDKIALESTMKVFNKFGWTNPDMKNVLEGDQEKLVKGFF